MRHNILQIPYTYIFVNTFEMKSLFWFLNLNLFQNVSFLESLLYMLEFLALTPSGLFIFASTISDWIIYL